MSISTAHSYKIIYKILMCSYNYVLAGGNKNSNSLFFAISAAFLESQCHV